METRTRTRTKIRIDVRKYVNNDKGYTAVLYNDDVSPAEKVAEVLATVFEMDPSTAFSKMMEIHITGRPCEVWYGTKEDVEKRILMAKKMVPTIKIECKKK